MSTTIMDESHHLFNRCITALNEKHTGIKYLASNSKATKLRVSDSKHSMRYAGIQCVYQLFLPRDALLSAVYVVVVCLSVCVCVCLSHSGIVSKRQNIGSRK